MSLPKILWIHDGTGLDADPEWRQAASEFEVLSVAGLADAQVVLARQDMDCVLVEGPIPDGDRNAVLEALRDIDLFLPVVFYDLDMTAAEAVRLHRSGAFNCLGQRDSLEALRQCLEQAAEERRCQSRRRFTTAREPWRPRAARAPGGATLRRARVVDSSSTIAMRCPGSRRTPASPVSEEALQPFAR